MRSFVGISVIVAMSGAACGAKDPVEDPTEGSTGTSTASTDGSSSEPTGGPPAICGDGEIDPGEACDDADADADDGCDACHVTPALEWSATLTAPGLLYFPEALATASTGESVVGGRYMGDGEGYWLAAVDAGGEVLWDRRFESSAAPKPAALTVDAGGSIYLLGDRLYRVGLDGTDVWQKDLPPAPPPPAPQLARLLAVGDAVYSLRPTVMNGVSLVRHDPVDGSPSWTTEIADPSEGYDFAERGAELVVFTDELMHAVDGATGQAQPGKPVPRSEFERLLAYRFLDDDLVVVGEIDDPNSPHFLRRVDPGGATVWEHAIAEDDGSPDLYHLILGPDRSIVVGGVGHDETRAYLASFREDGQPMWTLYSPVAPTVSFSVAAAFVPGALVQLAYMEQPMTVSGLLRRFGPN